MFFSCYGKAEFSAESSVSHDPSVIIIICWFGAQETCIIIIIINVKKKNQISKEQHLF